jgi:predicted CXXCH cytochrome family protein
VQDRALAKLVRKSLTIAILLFLFLLYGCGEKARYPVLSFFFDGVPVPGKAKEEVKVEKKEEIYKAKTAVEHGPYAGKQCSGCHVSGSNMLVVPKDELCLYCHVLDMKKKNIHGPLASGGCGVCHQPHLSRYSYMLVSEPKEFCMYCHKAEDVFRSEVHKTAEGQCTGCHDAHGSDKAYLLK